MRNVTIPYKEYQDLLSSNRVKEIEALNLTIEALKDDLNDEIKENNTLTSKNTKLVVKNNELRINLTKERTEKGDIIKSCSKKIKTVLLSKDKIKQDLNDEILLNQETYKRNRFLTMALAVTSVSILFLLGILAIIINN